MDGSESIKLTKAPELLSEKPAANLSEQALNLLSNHSEALGTATVAGAIGVGVGILYGLRRGRIGETTAALAASGEKALSTALEVPPASVFRFKPEPPQLSPEGIGLSSKTIAQYGSLGQEHLRAIESVKALTADVNDAAAVLDNFGRAHASLWGVDPRKGSTVDVLRELQRETGENLTPTRLSEAILSYDRLGGPFTVKQLQDPHLADLLIEHGNLNPYSARAVNTLSRLIGTQSLYRETNKIGVVSEYLSNGGNWMRFDTNDLQAAVALSSVRRDAAKRALGTEITISPDSVTRLRQVHDFK